MSWTVQSQTWTAVVSFASHSATCAQIIVRVSRTLTAQEASAFA
eukprot:SAG31_NODE_40970_length_278_cov_0.849162_1_plen_43_part_10